uniref:hypothetical protein n=1 Tax=Stappia sp. TaxID=1870903 RepID=UPI003BA8D8AA
MSGVATLALALPPVSSLAQPVDTETTTKTVEADSAKPSDADKARSKDTEEATLLDRIVLGMRDYLGGQSPVDIGTTIVGHDEFAVRTDGGGDANSFLRGLPNVQYQNETEDDAGVDGQKILDTRPELLSISGGRTYENNFIVNGIAANTVTGAVERNGGGELASDTSTPNAYRIYGLHPQTIFVPSDFVESATVIDSNAAARYGNFQGGVVSYELTKPSTSRWHGTASVEFKSDDLVTYNLATEDGLNPLDRRPPEFTKVQSSFSLTGPINEIFSVIAQYSRQDATTSKQKEYIYYSENVDEDSLNQFFRLQIDANTDYGKFTLEGMVTDYAQLYESPDWRNLQIDVQTRTYAGKFAHAYTFDRVDTPFGQILDLALESKLTFSSSAAKNVTGGDTAWVQQVSEFSDGSLVWTTPDTDLLAWCRVDPTRTNATICREGGFGGQKEQSQKQVGFSQSADGAIWAGTFNAGYDVTHTNARRARENDFTYYTSNTTLWDARSDGLARFNCLGREACSDDQYARFKSVFAAYDVNTDLNEFSAWMQFEQTFGWLTVRPGVRLQFDDYQNNVNIAPRLTASVSPTERIEITGGFNRYYNAASLAYAIRDKEPLGLTYRRSHTSSGDVDDVWTTTSTRYYTNTVADLDTPYTDEWSTGIKVIDPLTEGTFRLRYINRAMKDQYAKADLGDRVWQLTNAGTGAYESATAEYAKTFDVERIRFLENLTLTGSFTWSAQELSSNSYFEDEDDLQDRILYNGQSYSYGGFAVITGNMDIPMRAQLAMTSRWYEGRFDLGFAANYNFPFTGVEDTGRTEMFNGVRHEVWQDKDFDGTLTVDMHSSLELVQDGDRSVRLNLTVSNLFNETGNATADNSNPFIRGRSAWLGLNATF